MANKPKRANLKGPGKCIYCGATGLTHEHIFADWLEAYIPRSMQHHTVRVARITKEGETETFRRQTGDPYSRRIYCVCKTCNSGWMSLLQTDVRPFLEPMLIGKKTGVQKHGQRLLSAWVAMLVMVAEHMQRDKVAIPQSDRAYLREHRMPPTHWRIWIGQHARQHHPMITHNVLNFVTEKEIQALPFPPIATTQNTQTTTVCVGNYLVIHVMSSIVAHRIIKRWKLPEPVRSSMTQVWPIKSSRIIWPPRNSALTDAGLKLMADEFMVKAVPVAV